MKCQFQLIDGEATPKRYRCACGNVIASDKPPEAFRANCRQPREKPLPCVHLGEVVRLQACESCCGSVRIKIHACAVHGECTLAKAKGSTLPACRCESYQSRETMNIANASPPATSKPSN